MSAGSDPKHKDAPSSAKDDEDDKDADFDAMSEPDVDDDDERVLAAEAELRALPEPPAVDVHVEVAGPMPAGSRPTRVIAVSGARGGVGKTVVASNLALYLATIGRKVVLVDADAGGANLHTCLGMRKPGSLARAGRMGVRRDGALIEEALVKTPFPGLRLLHAGLDDPGPSAARAQRLVKLVAKLRELAADYVVIDMGVGWGREVVDAYLAVDLPISITVPEPTAIENTYMFFRAAFARFVLREAKSPADRESLSKHLKAYGSAPPPLDLLRELERQRSPLASLVRSAMESFRPNVIINQTRLRADLQLGFDMQSAARRRLGLAIEYMGHVDHDDTVWTCVRNRRPLLLEVPGAKSSKKLEKIARRVLTIDAMRSASTQISAVPSESHHDMLEINRAATDEEVRRAYKRCRELYAHDSLACYGLLEPHEIETLRVRLDEAFDVLLDPARRRPYELSVFPAGSAISVPVPAPAEVDDSPRELPEITPETVFTGALLRQVREARRVSLQDVSQKTKIGMPYLKAIEEDDFSQLPALVYASGFVGEFAKCLKLDAQHVSRTYVRRYKRYLEDKDRGLSR